MKRVWLCEGGNHWVETMPWLCPGCGKEVCDKCFDQYGHCKECALNKTEAEMIIVAQEAGVID